MISSFLKKLPLRLLCPKIQLFPQEFIQLKKSYSAQVKIKDNVLINLR